MSEQATNVNVEMSFCVRGETVTEIVTIPAAQLEGLKGLERAAAIKQLLIDHLTVNYEFGWVEMDSFTEGQRRDLMPPVSSNAASLPTSTAI